jgi:hypothetical protein
MPKTTFKTPEPPLNERLNGDYPFEVVGCDFGISTSKGKTNGSETMELKLKFFRDATFAQPLAQWTETLYFHESCDWKVHQFMLAANLQVNGRLVQKGDDVEFTEYLVIGLRGWATCLPEKDKSNATDDAGRVKEYNRVRAFITNKQKLDKHVTVGDGTEDSPF